MSFTSSHFDRLNQALVSAFTRDELRRLVSLCMDADFDHIAPEKGFADQVFDLVQWAKRQDRVEELVKCALDERPRNDELAALYHELPQPDDENGRSKTALRQWVLVAGTGRLSDFTPALAELSTHLGNRLANKGFRLVTGGWPGVDDTVARAFAAALDTQGIALEDHLIQVVTSDTPAFPGGRLVFVGRGEDYSKPVSLADAVILIGGLGGTMKTGELALRERKYVFPLADTGGVAKRLYIQMLKSWDSYKWMNISDAAFQRLARPQRSGVDAAIALMIDAATRT